MSVKQSLGGCKIQEKLVSLAVGGQVLPDLFLSLDINSLQQSRQYSVNQSQGIQHSQNQGYLRFPYQQTSLNSQQFYFQSQQFLTNQQNTLGLQLQQFYSSFPDDSKFQSLGLQQVELSGDSYELEEFGQKQLISKLDKAMRIINAAGSDIQDEQPEVQDKAKGLKQKFYDINILNKEPIITRNQRQGEYNVKPFKQFVSQMLEVIDNIENTSNKFNKYVLDQQQRGNFSKEQGQQFQFFAQNMANTRKTITKVLKQNGVEQFDPKDQQYDPYLHNAILETRDGSKENNVITDVRKKGYKLNDKVIRVADVVVNKKGDLE